MKEDVVLKNRKQQGKVPATPREDEDCEKNQQSDCCRCINEPDRQLSLAGEAFHVIQWL